jgi:hypothetical protein
MGRKKNEGKPLWLTDEQKVYMRTSGDAARAGSPRDFFEARKRTMAYQIIDAITEGGRPEFKASLDS